MFSGINPLEGFMRHLPGTAPIAQRDREALRLVISATTPVKTTGTAIPAFHDTVARQG